MKSNRRTFLLASVGLVATVSSGRAATAAMQDAEGGPIVYADIVQGAKNIPEDQRAERSCVLTNRFARNAEIVWRARVIDPKTSKAMDDTMLASVVVKLSDGQTFDMHFGAHPPAPNPPRDYYWTTSWLVPMDYATGTFGFTITATDPDGKTGEFKPFDVPTSLPTITDEVLSEVSSGGEDKESTAAS